MTTPDDGFEQIIGSLDLPVPEGAVTFDDDGLPAGPNSPLMWRSMLGRLEAELDTEGWDARPKLFVVSDASATEHQSPGLAEAVRRMAARDRQTNPEHQVVYEMSLLAELRGKPREAVIGLRVPPGAAAVILATEAWMTITSMDDYSTRSESFRPSKDPRRLEIRQLSLVTRSGRTATLARVRGYGPHLMAVSPEEMPQELNDEADRNLPPSAIAVAAKAASGPPSSVPQAVHATADDPSPRRAEAVATRDWAKGGLAGKLPERLARVVNAPDPDPLMTAPEILARMILSATAAEQGPLAIALDHPDPATRRARLLSLPDQEQAQMLVDIDALDAGDAPAKPVTGGRKARAKALRRPVGRGTGVMVALIVTSRLFRQMDEIAGFALLGATPDGQKQPKSDDMAETAQRLAVAARNLDYRTMSELLGEVTDRVLTVFGGQPAWKLAHHPAVAASAGLLPEDLFQKGSRALNAHQAVRTDWLDWWGPGLAEEMLLASTSDPDETARDLKGLPLPALAILTDVLRKLDPDLEQVTPTLPWHTTALQVFEDAEPTDDEQ